MAESSGSEMEWDMGDNKPRIRALSLFDGIGTGRMALKNLQLDVDCYYSSEVCLDANLVNAIRNPDIIPVGDIREIGLDVINSLKPIDLLLGASPCDEFSIANPWRLGFYPRRTGSLFYDFARVLYSLIENNGGRPVHWLFENVSSMSDEHRSMMSFFFNDQPTVWDASFLTAQKRKRYFWGNIPGMKKGPDALKIESPVVKDILCPFRKSTLEKTNCITSRPNSQLEQTGAKFTKPVIGSLNQESLLWTVEMERLFGFPDHYTDVAGIASASRQTMLGQAWSLPVVTTILAPLICYFRTLKKSP